MALINLESALRRALDTLKKFNEGCGLEILSYKRNRGITVLKLSSGNFRLVERGYLDQEVEVSEKQLSRQLKSMMKREFPRSRKVRMYCLNDPSQVGIERKRL